jgi:hypothetical protein
MKSRRTLLTLITILPLTNSPSTADTHWKIADARYEDGTTLLKHLQ